MKNGRLIVISGPSGVGKGTCKLKLLEKIDNLIESVSCTTRKPRDGEIDGIHYFFKTEEQFDEMLSKDAFLENAGVFGKRYGTPRGFVEKTRGEGKDVLLEIDVQGALQVKEKAPDAILIMLLPENLSVLKARLTGRGTETPEQIEGRFSKALFEIGKYRSFDFCVINETGKLDETVGKISKILETGAYSENKEDLVKTVVGDKYDEIC